jgi:hypothetical protein
MSHKEQRKLRKLESYHSVSKNQRCKPALAAVLNTTAVCHICCFLISRKMFVSGVALQWKKEMKIFLGEFRAVRQLIEK